MLQQSGTLVSSEAELVQAVSQNAPIITVRGLIDVPGPIQLCPGQTLTGEGEGAAVRFARSGLSLSADNKVSGLRIESAPQVVVLAIGSGPAARGTIDLSGLTCAGRVQLLFGDETDSADLVLQDFQVEAADATVAEEQPFGNGVRVLQGGLTIWNRASGPSRITLAMDDVRVGTAKVPVRGTGLFIAGAGEDGDGTIEAGHIVLGPIHADSSLDGDVTGTVAGGVFFLKGCVVASVVSRGSIVTRGANAVPVDNWGTMGSWVVHGDAISYGPNAIGFINAGTLDRLSIEGWIETYGEGARGCSIYGPTGTVSVRGVRTRGDAATGVQVVDRLDRLEVREAIIVSGNPGRSLVKGVMHEMPADGIHVEAGGVLTTVEVPTIQVGGRSAQAMRRDE